MPPKATRNKAEGVGDDRNGLAAAAQILAAARAAGTLHSPPDGTAKTGERRSPGASFDRTGSSQNQGLKAAAAILRNARLSESKHALAEPGEIGG